MSEATLDNEFSIGSFGDARLDQVGQRFFKSMCQSLTVCIRKLATGRAAEVAFGRFLGNKRVTTQIINKEFSEKTNKSCEGIKHVLCIQDTVQLTYPTQGIKKSQMGPTGNPDTKGLFAHPAVVVNAENRDVLGVSSIHTWVRSDEESNKSSSRPIEEKESIRWIEAAQNSKQELTNAELITVIGDRESDIFEFFDRVPDKRTHVIVRASHDRNLATEEKISERLDGVKAAGKHTITLPAITGQRKAREAELEIKFSKIKILDEDREIDLHCVSALEVSKVPEGESPISWVLLTTHKVDSLSSAIQILIWYTWRWIIEQIFRTMKNKGLKIEDSQVESPEKLKILATLSIMTAIKVMSLVEARNGDTEQTATNLFSDDEIIVLALILSKLEGRTDKQKNPFKKNSLSWAAWIVARLGGWKGYSSERPPGPSTMLTGLQKFQMQFDGWSLCQ